MNHKQIRKLKEIGIHAIRGGDAVGKHEVLFFGKNNNHEELKLEIACHSRSTYSLGALRAAAFLSKQKNAKLYSMQEVLGIACL